MPRSVEGGVLDMERYMEARYAVQVDGLSKRVAARRFGTDPQTRSDASHNAITACLISAL